MGTQTETDYSGDSKTSTSKPARNTVVAVWVYLLAVLMLIGFFDLSLRQTDGRLTITTILYFLGAATLTAALFRLAIGQFVSVAINVFAGRQERAEDRERV